MSDSTEPVIASYSASADLYDDERNLQSCWGRLSAQLTTRLSPGLREGTLVEIGCGTGHALRSMAAVSGLKIIGVEPAGRMREKAATNLADLPHIQLLDGRFENIPLPDQSVDYLYSLLAFHWTQDPARSVLELRRVLKPGARMELVFPGRLTGHEFTAATMPLFLRRFGLAWLREASTRRQHLTSANTRLLFHEHFSELHIDETSECHFDNLEGHWSWWLARAMANLPIIPKDERAPCDREIREALQRLATPQGIPYTIHLIHVTATA